MAVLGQKLKNFENFFFSKCVLIQDYFMLSLPKFAQTNPCAAIWAVKWSDWFPWILDFQQTPTRAALFLIPDPNLWGHGHHHGWYCCPSNQTCIPWKSDITIFKKLAISTLKCLENSSLFSGIYAISPAFEKLEIYWIMALVQYGRALKAGSEFLMSHPALFFCPETELTSGRPYCKSHVLNVQFKTVWYI